MSLGVLSHGVACPGGTGVESLFSAWPRTRVETASGNRAFETAQTDVGAAEYQQWALKPRLRRASALTYFLVEAVSQAVRGLSEAERKETGVVACFFLGCLSYSIRFYREITKDGRRFASPVLFPETVFNSPISHVASTLGIGGPVYSQIGDKSAWVSALRTAECWLRTGSAKQVVVVGAEEFDPHALDAFAAAGWMRSRAFIPGTGAGAVLVGPRQRGRAAISNLSEGYGFATHDEVEDAARECVAELEDECSMMQTATGWAAEREDRLFGDRLLRLSMNPGVEGFAASAAWDVIRACRAVETGEVVGDLIVPVWGLAQQVAAIQVGLGEARCSLA